MTAMLALPVGLDAELLAAAAIAEAGWPIGPRPMPCVCGLERGQHLAALPPGCTGYEHERVDALALAAVEAADRQVMDDLVDAMNDGYVPSGKTGPRVSDYGRCGRAVWYREQDPKPAGYRPAPVNWRRAALGKIVHEAAERVRSARYPWRRYEMTIDIPGLDRPGRIDEYDPVTGQVVDDKTCGDAKWAMVGDDGPTDEAWGQGFVYALALDEAGWPVRTVRIICIHRESGQEEHFTADYDPQYARDCLDELVALATMLDLGIVPPRAGVGPGSFPCSWCEHRFDCWNVDAAAAAGRSPESYTVLGEDPDKVIIEWAARQASAATKASTQADKDKAAAAALLVGVPAGVYGDMEVIPRSRRMPDYKRGFEEAAAIAELPDRYRPTGGVGEPPKRVDQWVEARPLRKATRDRLAREAKQGRPA